jgi:hypothetical protein
MSRLAPVGYSSPIAVADQTNPVSPVAAEITDDDQVVGSDAELAPPATDPASAPQGAFVDGDYYLGLHQRNAAVGGIIGGAIFALPGMLIGAALGAGIGWTLPYPPAPPLDCWHPPGPPPTP